MTSVLVGVSRFEQLQEIARALAGRPFTDEELAQIDYATKAI